MLYLCPRCVRKRRAIQTLQYINKKKYWAMKCVECKTTMALEDYEEKKNKRK